jgi:hypothetical protein
MRKTPWTLVECEASLETAISELQLRGKGVTQKSYRALARGRNDLASWSTTDKAARANGTTVSAMRKKALKKWLASLGDAS